MSQAPAHFRDRDDIVLEVRHLVVNFVVKAGTVQAVSDVSFDVARGETLGLVGESGCGKSTVGRAVMQLPAPTEGKVLLEGQDLTMLSGEALRQTRPRLQMIFQDPISSLNPRRRIRDIVAEGLHIWGRDDQRQRVEEVMQAVGLDPEAMGDRRPHQFSGGQCQRICIARSLALDPDVLICDEPVSALDVSVQAQVLNLLADLQEEFGLTYLFIAHDLSVVQHISDRVAVMYLGRIVEMGDVDSLFSRPKHPYMEALLSAIPDPDPDVVGEQIILQGDVPSPANPPTGCHFHPRCRYAQERCRRENPELVDVDGQGHLAACHYAQELSLTGVYKGETA